MSVFSAVYDAITYPGRKLAEAIDTHPSAGQIKDFTEVVRAADDGRTISLVVEKSGKVVRELPALEGIHTLEHLESFCKGINYGFDIVRGLKRSDIKPALKSHRLAVKEAKLAKQKVDDKAAAAREAVEEETGPLVTGFPVTQVSQMTVPGPVIEPVGSPA